ncbi:MAG: Lrp/AsnC family transcriptional regulator [Rhodobacteraceae bacterium]|nr:Lrp/AsnC family transcriptional regulator [Paracoccaceae bacterium]
MLDTLSDLDQALLDRFQRDLPLVSQPYAAIAASLGRTEAEVLARLRSLADRGMITRVGATVRPNTVGASTLAALAVPEAQIETVADIVGAEPGVNHSYLREHVWNLWFVATAPDRERLAQSLERIAVNTGLEVLDLPLLKAFNIDLGFSLKGDARATPQPANIDPEALRPADRPIVQAMTEGLPLIPLPFAAIAAALGRSESDIIARIEALQTAGILTRIGVIVRHRAIGWKSNAMVVWDVPEDRIDIAGPVLARHPGVTLCYQRPRIEGLWPFSLFSMIHAQSREAALETLRAASALPELAGCTHQVLFSVKCFKQQGALVHQEAAE